MSRARWAETYLWIRTDHSPPKMLPFRRTRSQKLLRRKMAAAARKAAAHHQPPHVMVLKSRRFKATTEFLSEIFTACTTENNVEALVLAQTHPDSQKILRMCHTFYSLIPAQLQPRRRGENKAEFDYPDFNSLLTTGTANAVATSRSGGLQWVLDDEAAWGRLGLEDREQLWAALTEAARRGVYVCQSTPRPFGWFREKHDEIISGQCRGMQLIVCTHWEDDECREPITPSMAEELYLTMSEEESNRAILAGFDVSAPPPHTPMEVWERLAWRRTKWGKLGRLAPQEYLEDNISCWVALGQYFYDPDALARHLIRAKNATPLREIPLSEDATGEGSVILWEEFDPLATYLVLSDSAEGGSKGDPSASALWNLSTMTQAGEVWVRCRPYVFARLTHQHLCEPFGKPLWVIERKHPGPAVIDAALVNHDYQNLYRIEKRDDIRGGVEMKWGWDTNPFTRVQMLESSREALHEDHITVLSERILGDCSRFQLKQIDPTHARYEAAAGAHDEGPILLGMLTQMAKTTTLQLTPPTVEIW